jgi:hypothetical protein
VGGVPGRGAGGGAVAILVVVALVVVGKGGDYYHVEVEGWHFGFLGWLGE